MRDFPKAIARIIDLNVFSFYRVFFRNCAFCQISRFALRAFSFENPTAFISDWRSSLAHVSIPLPPKVPLKQWIRNSRSGIDSILTDHYSRYHQPGTYVEREQSNEILFQCDDSASLRRLWEKQSGRSLCLPRKKADDGRANGPRETVATTGLMALRMPKKRRQPERGGGGQVASAATMSTLCMLDVKEWAKSIGEGRRWAQVVRAYVGAVVK